MGPAGELGDAILAAISARRGEGLLVVGICGAQGSGKSTLALRLLERLEDQGIRAATLSLDDLYLTKAERGELAARVHPLFATRGVPGTHDVELGQTTIAALERGEAAPLPRFDKGADDRAPECDWPRAPAGTQVLLLEGWCVGATPQNEAELAEPVNSLEAHEDPLGLWRTHANAELAGPYRALFARLDLLVLLAAPGLDVVAQWRGQAEEALRQAGAPAAMSESEIARFVAHYERLTRHILREMPERADIVAWLDADRGIVRIDC